MKDKKLFFFPLFSLLLLIAGFCRAQTGQNYRIDNPDADTVFYCNGPVVVAPGISIENLNFEDASDGIKISIVNYRNGEDRLFYAGNRFASKWDAAYGNLELTGAGTAEEYEEAVRQVFYENAADIPSTVPRSFSITLLDADYLPYTEHFYLYIVERGIAWTEARDSAENMNYYGLQGYLATITSRIENDFIWTKIDGVGWIGASDSEKEETWKWMTGPEKGTVFWQGGPEGNSVNGEYSNWNRGEPNNVLKDWGEDEDYAHVNADPNSIAKSWNDLPNEGDRNNPNGYYYPEGFVVEFGGMAGDPDVQLSASAVVAWSTKPDVQLIGFSERMCGDNRQQLLLQMGQDISTVLKPAGADAKVEAPATPEPVIVLPNEKYGTYRFILEILDSHACSWVDTVEVHYRHQPTAVFQLDEAKCAGYNLQLFYEGEVLGDARFDWYSNDTLYHSGMNVDSLEIPLGFGDVGRTVGLRINENGCVDSMEIDVTVTPVLDFHVESPEGCPPLDVQFVSSSTEPVAEYHWDLGDGTTSEEEEPVHTYQNSGITDVHYDVSLRVVSDEGCENSGTTSNMIAVHPIPTIGFDFDEATCYTENAMVSYTGSAGDRDDFLWDLTGFEPDEVTADPGNSAGPLRFTLSKRPAVDIGLQVISAFGCKTDTLLSTYRRKPNFSLQPDTITGCPPLDVAMQLEIADTADVVDYTWQIGEELTASGLSVSETFYDSDRIYDVSVVGASSLTGCIDTLLLPGKIRVYPVPKTVFNANPPRVLISDPGIQFENLTTGASVYSWDFGDQSAMTDEQQPLHRYEDIGKYEVALYAINDFGCADTASAGITVAFDKIFPPNAFSPNAEKPEDREFRIHAKWLVNEGYELLIFNRWGQIIFESHSPDNGWNGRMQNGDFAPAGVYVWVIEYHDFMNEKHAQQGTVTLIY